MNASNDNFPTLSVVMPVHNARRFLNDSIASVLNQTFDDFELVILDDASSDDSSTILREWQHRDPRVRVFQSKRNLGLSRSSNRVVSYARAPIVARMDADDVSHPDRFRRQLEVLQNHADVVAVGALCDGIDAHGQTTRPRDRWRILRRSSYIPFPHGSAMFRRQAFEAIGGYREDFIAGEDQDFFFRMTDLGRVVTLPDVLYHFRYHTDNATVLTRARAVNAIRRDSTRNGQELASLYMLGSMRLWAGESPGILPEVLAIRSLHWDLRSLTVLTSATLGHVSPSLLRFLLRSFICARDRLASVYVKDRRAYEWRLR